MAYRDDITALSPDHLWRFDTNYVDSVGSLNATNGGFTVTPISGSFSPGFSGGAFNGGAITSLQITEDSTGSVQSNNTTDSITLGTASTVDQELDSKAIGGWIRLSDIQLPPKSLYGEGTNSTSQFRFVGWAGNRLLLDVELSSGAAAQIIADRVLQPERVYHIFATFKRQDVVSAIPAEIELFLDGVSQGIVETLAMVTLTDRDVGEWGEPGGNVSVGGANVILNAPETANYAYWASWGDKTLPTASEIRSELFEKGCLPNVTITSDTEANMQTALDAIAGTLRPDEPLNIRIEDVSGGGTLNLSADNITHDPLASIHVQFVGTGTLNYTNTNGSNASIGSTPNGGTLNILNEITLTVEPLIADSEVRIYEAGTTTEVDGIESSGTSFATQIATNSVDIVIHKEEYEYERFTSVDTSTSDTTIRVTQIFDRNYKNP